MATAYSLAIIAAGPAAMAQTSAQETAERQFSVPAGPLGQSVLAVSRTFGVPVLVPNALVEGKQAPAVSGAMTAAEALGRVLSGSNLIARPTEEGGFVLAQQMPESGPIRLAPIVVQGELLDRSLEDSPTSAVVILGEEFEESGGDIDLTDVLERTPGVGAPSDGNLTIRGIRSRPVGGFGSQTINVQVDGLSLPNFSSVTNGPYSTWDLDQVEILRGPQSTQQGRNALAGAIIVRSQDPTFEQEFKLRAEAGSFGFKRGSLVANTPVVDDKLALRLSADILETDGFIDNVTLGTDSDPATQKTYRAKVLLTPTEQSEAILSLTYNDSESGGEGEWIDEASFPDRRVNFSNRQNREEAEQWIYGLRLGYDFDNGMTVNSETTYLDSTTFRFADFDGTARDVPFAESGTAFLRDFPGFDINVFEQDLSLSFSNDRFEGTVGLFYTDIREAIDEGGDSFDFTGLLPPLPGVSAVNTARSLSDNRRTNIAAYGEADVFADEVFPGLSFTLGARYDYEKFEDKTAVVWDPGFPQVVIDATPSLANSEIRTSGSFTAFLPKIGVNYEFNPSHRVSLTYQQGYRAGGAVFNTLEGQVEFDPEFTDNIELAYRGRFLDDRLGVRSNLFYTYWRDQQVPVNQGGSGQVRIENVGKSELYGLEFAVDAVVMDSLYLDGSVAFVETRFLDFVQADGSNLAGNEFPDAPPFTAQITGTYDFTDNLSLSLSGRYRASAFGDAANSADQETDSYFVADTQLTFRSDDGWVTGLYLNNIFDKEYAVVRSGSGGYLGTTATRSLEIGAPRTVGVFLQKTF